MSFGSSVDLRSFRRACCGVECVGTFLMAIGVEATWVSLFIPSALWMVHGHDRLVTARWAPVGVAMTRANMLAVILVLAEKMMKIAVMVILAATLIVRIEGDDGGGFPPMVAVL